MYFNIVIGQYKYSVHSVLHVAVGGSHGGAASLDLTEQAGNGVINIRHNLFKSRNIGNLDRGNIQCGEIEVNIRAVDIGAENHNIARFPFEINFKRYLSIVHACKIEISRQIRIQSEFDVLLDIEVERKRQVGNERTDYIAHGQFALIEVNVYTGLSRKRKLRQVRKRLVVAFKTHFLAYGHNGAFGEAYREIAERQSYRYGVDTQHKVKRDIAVIVECKPEFAVLLVEFGQNGALFFEYKIDYRAEKVCGKVYGYFRSVNRDTAENAVDNLHNRLNVHGFFRGFGSCSALSTLPVGSGRSPRNKVEKARIEQIDF